MLRYITNVNAVFNALLPQYTANVSDNGRFLYIYVVVVVVGGVVVVVFC